jgi:hypothetical protein
LRIKTEAARTGVGRPYHAADNDDCYQAQDDAFYSEAFHLITIYRFNRRLLTDPEGFPSLEESFLSLFKSFPPHSLVRTENIFQGIFKREAYECQPHGGNNQHSHRQAEAQYTDSAPAEFREAAQVARVGQVEHLPAVNIRRGYQRNVRLFVGVSFGLEERASGGLLPVNHAVADWRIDAGEFEGDDVSDSNILSVHGLYDDEAPHPDIRLHAAGEHGVELPAELGRRHDEGDRRYY